jgi:tRNA A37 threonylcarbamoyladenosine modification protein TsaB
LQKISHNSTLLIIPLSSPLLLGVYQNNILVETLKSDKKTSESLLPLVEDVLQRYELDRIIYTRGPGSYMAIKLTYIMLKTIELVQKIPLFGCSAFECNGDKPIKAIGNLYFIKEKETIITKKLQEKIEQAFWLPKTLDELKLDKDATPDYSLPAV